MVKLNRTKLITITIILISVFVINIQLSFNIVPKAMLRKSVLYEIYNTINPLVLDDFTLEIDDPKGLTNGKINGVVYFGRDDCENCVMFNAILKEYLEEFPNVVYKYDTSKFREAPINPEILEKYCIYSVPTLVLIDQHGNSIEKLEVEGLSLPEIRQGLADLFDRS